MRQLAGGYKRTPIWAIQGTAPKAFAIAGVKPAGIDGAPHGPFFRAEQPRGGRSQAITIASAIAARESMIAVNLKHAINTIVSRWCIATYRSKWIR